MTPEAISTLEQHLHEALRTPPDEARRLFHGRGKRWPDLEQISVDWLEGLLLVSLYRRPAAPALEALIGMLLQLDQRVLLQHRYSTDRPAQWLRGEPAESWLIRESGLRYQLDLGSKQNSGLFLDMRHGRHWVQQHAANKSVLNLFAYTCAFSLAAIAGGARHVVNLDMAKAALSRGRENHRLNQHDLSRVSFLGHDLFKSWGKLKRLGPFDLVIIDPPSFQKGSFVLTSDYQRVLRRLPEMLNAQAMVLACCNDPDIGADFLLTEMAREAPCLAFVERLDNPPEFVERNPGGGLKAMVFQHSGLPPG